jgi:hypothetical protein
MRPGRLEPDPGIVVLFFLSSLTKLVGASGFEPEASCAQGRRATRLRYAPTEVRIDYTALANADAAPIDPICLHGLNPYFETVFAATLPASDEYFRAVDHTLIILQGL